jgi:ribose-phosphate pyrophosphokinase
VWLGPSASHFADKLSKYSDIHLVKGSIRYFPDGESCIKLEEDVRNENIVIIQNTAPPQDENLRHLYQMIDVLKYNKARTITCIVPYLAYSRQDRRTHSGEPFSSEIVIRTIEMLGAHKLVTVELHNPNMDMSTSMEIVNISTDDLLKEWIRNLNVAKPVLISPDKGSRDRIQKLSQSLEIPFISLDKYKNVDGKTWYENNDDLEVDGKTAIIIDDLCSSGSTLIPLGQHLKSHGISDVKYGVTHFFANSSRIKDKLDVNLQIYCTDTIPSRDSNISIENLLYSFMAHERSNTL